MINRQEDMRERERESAVLKKRERETRRRENGRARIEADDARARGGVSRRVSIPKYTREASISPPPQNTLWFSSPPPSNQG